MKYFGVKEVARMLGVKASDISMAFYRGMLRDDLAPIVSNRRMIPETYIETIEMVLKRAGRVVGTDKGGAL